MGRGQGLGDPDPVGQGRRVEAPDGFFPDRHVRTDKGRDHRQASDLIRVTRDAAVLHQLEDAFRRDAGVLGQPLEAQEVPSRYSRSRSWPGMSTRAHLPLGRVASPRLTGRRGFLNISSRHDVLMTTYQISVICVKARVRARGSDGKRPDGGERTGA